MEGLGLVGCRQEVYRAMASQNQGDKQWRVNKDFNQARCHFLQSGLFYNRSLGDKEPADGQEQPACVGVWAG